MSRKAFAISGAGGVAGLYGVYVLVNETHNRPAWFWLFLGALLLFVAQIQTVQDALAQRDEAQTSGARELRNALAEISEEGHEILPAANEEVYNDWVERGAAKIARYDTFSAERFKRGLDPSQPLIHPSVERLITWRLDLLNEIASGY
jgi:hypothetical protein